MRHQKGKAPPIAPEGPNIAGFVSSRRVDSRGQEGLRRDRPREFIMSAKPHPSTYWIVLSRISAHVWASEEEVAEAERASNAPMSEGVNAGVAWSSQSRNPARHHAGRWQKAPSWEGVRKGRPPSEGVVAGSFTASPWRRTRASGRSTSTGTGCERSLWTLRHPRRPSRLPRGTGSCR